MRFAWPFTNFFLIPKGKSTWWLAVENLNHDVFSVPKSISLASHSCLSNIELTELLVFVAAVKTFIFPRLTCFMKLLGVVRLRSIPFLQHWLERSVSHCNLLIWLVLIKQRATSKCVFLSLFLGRSKWSSSIYKRAVTFAIALKT